jgi:aspartate aminotransferase
MEMAPADPIMGLSVAYNADKNPNKQNLGIGAYRDNNGKPYILPCVKEAEERILAAGMDHEYSGIDGIPSYRKKA